MLSVAGGALERILRMVARATRATRPLRSATRRPEVRRATLENGGPHWLEPLLAFRPASRLCYQKRFFKHASSRKVAVGKGGATVPVARFGVVAWILEI